MSTWTQNSMKDIPYSSDKTIHDYRTRFIKRNKFNQQITNVIGRNPRSWSRFVETGLPNFFSPKGDDGSIPKVDHGSMYREKETGKIAIVFHPYSTIDNLHDSLDKWCRDRNLRLAIYDQRFSWYSPGQTCLVIISSFSHPEITVEQIIP